MAMATVNNGVNVQALLDAREALKGVPEAAKFTWRASCKWQNGTHSKTKVHSFFGLGQEQGHKTETSFDADHPEIFASADNGITPIEYVLVGLASCLTAASAESGNSEHVTVVVIGAGHAGLAASRFLNERSLDHVVIERGEVANSWRRERWDSLRLLTPNWQCRLPGYRYDGPDPDGYM